MLKTKRKVPVIPSDEDVATMIRYAGSPKVHCILLVLARTGIRWQDSGLVQAEGQQGQGKLGRRRQHSEQLYIELAAYPPARRILV